MNLKNPMKYISIYGSKPYRHTANPIVEYYVLLNESEWNNIVMLRVSVAVGYC